MYLEPLEPLCCEAPGNRESRVMASAIRQERDAQDTRTSANLSTNIWTGDGTRQLGGWLVGRLESQGGGWEFGPRQTTNYKIRVSGNRTSGLADRCFLFNY